MCDGGSRAVSLWLAGSPSGTVGYVLLSVCTGANDLGWQVALLCRVSDEPCLRHDRDPEALGRAQ